MLPFLIFLFSLLKKRLWWVWSTWISCLGCSTALRWAQFTVSLSRWPAEESGWPYGHCAFSGAFTMTIRPSWFLCWSSTQTHAAAFYNSEYWLKLILFMVLIVATCNGQRWKMCLSNMISIFIFWSANFQSQVCGVKSNINLFKHGNFQIWIGFVGKKCCIFFFKETMQPPVCERLDNEALYMF